MPTRGCTGRLTELREMPIKRYVTTPSRRKPGHYVHNVTSSTVRESTLNPGCESCRVGVFTCMSTTSRPINSTVISITTSLMKSSERNKATKFNLSVNEHSPLMCCTYYSVHCMRSAERIMSKLQKFFVSASDCTQ